MLDPMEVVAVVVDHLRMEAVLAMEDQVETVEDLGMFIFLLFFHFSSYSTHNSILKLSCGGVEEIRN